MSLTCQAVKSLSSCCPLGQGAWVSTWPRPTRSSSMTQTGTLRWTSKPRYCTDSHHIHPPCPMLCVVFSFDTMVVAFLATHVSMLWCYVYACVPCFWLLIVCHSQLYENTCPSLYNITWIVSFLGSFGPSNKPLHFLSKSKNCTLSVVSQVRVLSVFVTEVNEEPLKLLRTFISI